MPTQPPSSCRHSPASRASLAADCCGFDRRRERRLHLVRHADAEAKLCILLVELYDFGLEPSEAGLQGGYAGVGWRGGGGHDDHPKPFSASHLTAHSVFTPSLTHTLWRSARGAAQIINNATRRRAHEIKAEFLARLIVTLRGQTDLYAVAIKTPPEAIKTTITVRLRRKGGDPLLMVRLGAEPPACRGARRLSPTRGIKRLFDAERNEHSVTLRPPTDVEMICIGVQ